MKLVIEVDTDKGGGRKSLSSILAVTHYELLDFLLKDKDRQSLTLEYAARGFTLQARIITSEEVSVQKTTEEYNPSYIKGKPELSGWYIAASLDNRGGLYTELPLFFHSNTGKWCTVGSFGLEASSFSDDIVAYMPLPKYKL